MTEIQLHKTEKGGQFELFYDGTHAGLMDFVWKDENTFAITHTEVDQVFGGKGLGKDLVNAGVNFARENNFKILPLCSYAKKVLSDNEDFKDILV